MLDNIVKMTDSYKVSHYKQYPPNTTKVYSYMESRGGKWDETTFFGLQYFLKKYLVGQVVTKEKIQAAEKFWNLHFGRNDVFRADLWYYILNNYDGYLPVEINAVLEGLTVQTHNVLYTIENTDPKCFWLTNYLETLLQQVWCPLTVCTYSRNMKSLISKYLRRNGDLNGLDFKLHDFGYRGVSSPETAAIAGAAHLVNFLGTDTASGLELIDEYYGNPMAGCSIPATEHSTITSWGKENELEAYRNMLEQYPNELIAIVSDSYDVYNACENYFGDKLKEIILNRKGTVVIRPDSGDPPIVICKILEILGNKFGYYKNEKGYRVLDDHIRIIQGDGIDFQMVDNILYRMERNGWSATNIAFGSGGNLLQRHDRDEQKIAVKCSYATIDGQDVDVFKCPVDAPDKRSKAGKLALVMIDGVYHTINEKDLKDPKDNKLVTVFKDGRLLVDQHFDEIRTRARL